MKIKINLVERVAVQDWKPMQYIDGDLVDGVVKANKSYIYFPGCISMCINCKLLRKQIGDLCRLCWQETELDE